jgi:hypothetical protein
MNHCTGAKRTALALLLTGVAISASACSAPEAEPAAARPPSAPAPSEPAGSPPVDVSDPPVATPGTEEPAAEQASDDGTWHAKVVRAREDALVLDKVQLLDGAAAETARAEDGQPEPGADVPYVRNRNQQLRTLPVADDVDLQVIHCPQDGCGLAPWPYADLVAGKPLPYGTPSIPFSVTVVDGKVVALSEVYLP